MTDTILCLICGVSYPLHMIYSHNGKKGLCKACHEKAQKRIKGWSDEVALDG